MNKGTIGMLMAVAALLTVALLISAMPADGILTTRGDTTIVDTRLPGKGIEGYNGATPVRIYICKNKVVKIATQPSQETPKYMRMARQLLTRYEGRTVTKAAKAEIDGVTGATYTSEALKKNVKAGLEYYKKHGK